MEPQAQVIMQHIKADGFQYPVSTVSFHSTNAVTGRVGARLLGHLPGDAQSWKQYLKLNLCRNFHRHYDTVFGGENVVATNIAGTSLELLRGGGP